MKYLLYGFAFMFIFACKKDKKPINTSLYGKWKLTASAISTGGAMEETVADPNNPFYIEFKGNGDYINSTTVNNPMRFSIDSNTVTVTGNLQVATPVTYHYEVENGTLTLSPIRPYMCIEGCYTKYINVK